jgi:DNA polymerase, archaea type
LSFGNSQLVVDRRIESGECRLPWYPHEEKRKYLGGLVLEPKRGFYEKKPVYVLDVKSLYPSMMINHNISFDTVNCECCRGNEVAKVSYNIMKLINENLAATERRDTYWICKDRTYTGIIPRLLKQFRDERFKQQKIGNEPMQLALKNLINGCYGLFGSEGFRYADYRVAELTTAFGRETLTHMQQIAKEVYGFDIIYGDTDSIFLTNVMDENDIKKFIFECHILLNIDVELSDTYRKFLMVKKKHYIGIHFDDSKEPDIKGMERIKSDRPSWINRIEKRLVEDIKNNIRPTKKIRDEYRAMENNKVPLEELRIQLMLTKNPKEYKINSLQRIVGTELNASQGETIVYYKSTTAGGGTSNPNLISPRKYLQILQTSLEETINLLGYDYTQDIVGYTKIHDYMIT